MTEATQTYATHRQFIPRYHFFAFGVFCLNALWALWSLIRFPSVGTFLGVLVAAALLVLIWDARAMALRAQDRVIRVEMERRCDRVLPADLRGRFDELTLGQVIALRFASDRELPGLVQRVLTDRITDGEAIKKLITEWRPDTYRV
jgi:hypothetical protein